jgi:transaldolase
VNTLPPDTFAAYRDHGRPEVRIGPTTIAQAHDRLAALARTGIKLDDITQFLETDGVTKFSASYAALLNGVGQKALALSGAS